MNVVENERQKKTVVRVIFD